MKRRFSQFSRKGTRAIYWSLLIIKTNLNQSKPIPWPCLLSFNKNTRVWFILEIRIQIWFSGLIFRINWPPISPKSEFISKRLTWKSLISAEQPNVQNKKQATKSAVLALIFFVKQHALVLTDPECTFFLNFSNPPIISKYPDLKA